MLQLSRVWKGERTLTLELFGPGSSFLRNGSQLPYMSTIQLKHLDWLEGKVQLVNRLGMHFKEMCLSDSFRTEFLPKKYCSV